MKPFEQPELRDTPAAAFLRHVTRGTEYEGRLFLVGGYVRDKLLGRPASGDDLDLVLEGDAGAVARLLWDKRVATHPPVEFPTFGTAMTHVRVPDETAPVQVEIVTARAETYRQGSRKPIVTPGTLATDAERRDFTVNTFLENLHTGEILDPTGRGYDDLAARVLRTPLDPLVTFSDDPLRMLRACRFAAKLGFDVAPATLDGIVANADRCNEAHGISWERIRDELNKTLLTSDAPRGLELMRTTGLLDQFAPELAAMHGVTQNRYHLYDVWTHTLVALGNLPPEAPLTVRLATLLHDVGKPLTRTGEEGEAHFYNHENVGADMARTILGRLRYSNDDTETIVKLVALHMRMGSYESNWSNGAVRRLIRAVGDLRESLFMLSRADQSAANVRDFPPADLEALRVRMEKIEVESGSIADAVSPLDGRQLMALGVPSGPLVGKIKAILTDAVVNGDLAPDDTDTAAEFVRQWLAQEKGEQA